MPSAAGGGSGAVTPGIAQTQEPAVAEASSLPASPLKTKAVPARIVLTGFMGAGKTTVGNLLARRLGYRFVDADAEIEAGTGATIAELFQEHGEPWFRELEHQTIRRLLHSESLVLALGGGAIEDERTRNLLLNLELTSLVHLEASIETVLRRCRGTESLRPVLRDAANLNDRYLRRLPLYRQAHMTVAVDSASPAAVVQAILDRFSR